MVAFCVAFSVDGVFPEVMEGRVEGDEGHDAAIARCEAQEGLVVTVPHLAQLELTEVEHGTGIVLDEVAAADKATFRVEFEEHPVVFVVRIGGALSDR